jgi:hypothetical protein
MPLRHGRPGVPGPHDSSRMRDARSGSWLRHLSPGRRGSSMVRALPSPSPAELKRLVQRIAERIGRSLERSGLISGKRSDAESAIARMRVSRSTQARRRRSMRCWGLRSPTGSRSARKRASGCSRCRCCRASPDRAYVVPKTRAAAANKANECGEASATDRQRSLTWAQRLKRVFTRRRFACLNRH